MTVLYRNILEQRFIEGEARSLYKESSRSFILFIVFIFISFLTIYLTANGIRYLKGRMDDPYTNWLNVPFVSEMDYQEKLMSPDILDKYQIKKISPYRLGKLPVLIEGREYFKKYQTVDQSDPIFNAILTDENVIYLDSLIFNIENYSNGVILSKDIAFETQLNIENGFLQVNDFQGHDVFFPVLAIVNRLPNSCDIAISPVLENMRLLDVRESGFLYFSDLSYEYELMVKSGVNGTDTYLRDSILKELSIFEINENGKSINDYDLYTVQFNSQVHIDSLQSLIKDNNEVVLHIPFKSNMNYNEIDPPHYFACNFMTLESVEEFAEYIFTIGLDVEIGAVKSKKNFALVSLLTIVSLLFTILFASSSIVTIIINRVSLHIASVKKTLGTMMAFGLSRKIIISYYLKLFMLIFISIIVTSLILLLIIHLVLNGMYKEIGFYYPFTYLLLYAAFVLGILLLSVYMHVKNKLSHYPSDLIYNR